MTSVKPLRYGKVDSDILYFMHKENAVYPSFRRSEWKYASKKSVSSRLTEGYINTDNAEK